MLESSWCFHLLIVSSFEHGLKFPVPLHVKWFWIITWVWLHHECYVVQTLGFGKILWGMPMCLFKLQWANGLQTVRFVLPSMGGEGHVSFQCSAGCSPWLFWVHPPHIAQGETGTRGDSCTGLDEPVLGSLPQDFSLTLQPACVLFLQPGRRQGFYHSFSSPHSTDLGLGSILGAWVADSIKGRKLTLNAGLCSKFWAPSQCVFRLE